MLSPELLESLPRPLAFVFGGGATYGAAQLGMLRALQEAGIKPDFVIGTSVGSLNAAIMAEDPDTAVERLTALWTDQENNAVFSRKVTDAMRVALGRPYVIDPSALQALLQKAFKARLFEELAIPAIAVSTDLDSGETVTYNSGNLLYPLQASAAIPGVFPWVEIGDRRLVDGGVTANVPIRQALTAGAKSLVVLDCGFGVPPIDGASTVFKVLWQALAILGSNQVRRDLNEAIEAVPVIYMPIVSPEGARPDSFAKAEDMAQRAYAASQPFLTALEIDGPGLYGERPVLFTSPKERAVSPGEVHL